MLDECSPEDRERYEKFIEYYDLLGLRQEESGDADGDDEAEAPQSEEPDNDAADDFGPAEEDGSEDDDDYIIEDHNESGEQDDPDAGTAAEQANKPAINADSKDGELDQ